MTYSKHKISTLCFYNTLYRLWVYNTFHIAQLASTGQGDTIYGGYKQLSEYFSQFKLKCNAIWLKSGLLHSQQILRVKTARCCFFVFVFRLLEKAHSSKLIYFFFRSVLFFYINSKENKNGCCLYPQYKQCETLNQFLFVPDLVVMNIQMEITQLHRIWVLDYYQQIFIFCLKRREQKDTLNVCFFKVHTALNWYLNLIICPQWNFVNMLSML